MLLQSEKPAALPCPLPSPKQRLRENPGLRLLSHNSSSQTLSPLPLRAPEFEISSFSRFFVETTGTDVDCESLLPLVLGYLRGRCCTAIPDDNFIILKCTLKEKCPRVYHRYLMCVHHSQAGSRTVQVTQVVLVPLAHFWMFFLLFSLFHTSKPHQESRGWILPFTTKSDTQQILLPI